MVIFMEHPSFVIAGYSLWWRVFEKKNKKNACTVCNRPFFLFKEKQLTRRHKNWTTKPQQGKGNGLKDELGGMSYTSLRWLLGAENVYWYGDQGGKSKKRLIHRAKRTVKMLLEMGRYEHESIAGMKTVTKWLWVCHSFIWKHCSGWAVATRSKEMNSDLSVLPQLLLV